MNKTLKSALALLLALLMFASVMAVPAAAAGVLEPKNVKASLVANGTITVTWDMMADRDRSAVGSIRVDWSTDQTTWKTAYTTTDTYAHSARISTFVDGGDPLPGTTYYFSVLFVSKLGIPGTRSNVASVKTAGTAPIQPTTPSTPSIPSTPSTPSTPTQPTKPAASNGIPKVTNVKANCKTVGSTKVTLTWDKLSDSDLSKVSGLYIDVSPDQKNWKNGATIAKGYYETTIDTVDGDALKSGTTYYFRLYYYYQTSKFDAKTGKNIREFGPETIISYKVDDQKSGVIKRWNTLKKIAADGTYKFTEKSSKYDRQKLVKGTKIVWTCPYYTVTFKVTSANAKKANYTATIKCAKGYENYFYFDDGKTTEKGSIVYADYFYKGSQEYKVNVYANTENIYDLYGYSRYNEYSDEIEIIKKLNVACPVYFVLSQKLTHDFGLASVTQNSINLGRVYAYSYNGVNVFYRVSGAEKWTKKSFKNQTMNPTLKKLKAGTLYEIKLQAYETVKHPLTGKKINLTEDYAKIYKLYTGSSKAPEIKSVKVTSVKMQSNYIDGHYNGNIWIAGFYDNYTQVKMTVTLKNRPKSMAALKCLNATWSGGISKGKGNTFNITMVMNGKHKGATKDLSFVGISNILKQDGETYYLGESKAATKKVTLK